jgi:protein SCO1/2
MYSRMPNARLLLAAAVTAVTAVTVGCASGGNTAQDVGLVHIKVSLYRGRVVSPPVAKPGIVLTDTGGQRYDFRTRTADKVTLLFFGYTHCPDECPLTMSETAAALRDLTPAQQARIQVVFVTVDPARDTGPVLRRWLDQFNPAFVGLTGTLDAIAAAANAADIPVGRPVRQPNGSYTLDHGTEMLAFTPDNRAHLAFFPSTAPAAMAHDLELLVTGHHP